MPKVLNKRSANIPADAVYVGRPTKWGNPFSHIPNGTLAKHVVKDRNAACDAHKNWINEILAKDPTALDRIRKELKGKDLVCWCAPARCHADYLMQLANS